MARWEKIALTLNDSKAFKMHHLKGPIAKNRFERLVSRYRNWVKSGSHPTNASSQDAAFQSVMEEVIPKLDVAEKELLSQTLGKRGRPRKFQSESNEAPENKKPLSKLSHVALAPSPLQPQPSLPVDSDNQLQPAGAKASRQRFTPKDDLLLATFVKETLPFRAKFGAISMAWEDVATKLGKSSEFSKENIKGPIVRYRFENLVSKYRERIKRNEGRVVGPKGVPAGELEELMTELVALLDGGDAATAAVLARNVVTGIGAVDSAAPRASTTQDEDSNSCTQSESSPPPRSSPELASVLNQSSPTEQKRSESIQLAGKSAELLNEQFLASSNKTNLTDVAELKRMLNKMMEHQIQFTENMMLLQREERLNEAERQKAEQVRQREEREKDRQALTATVTSILMTALNSYSAARIENESSTL